MSHPPGAVIVPCQETARYHRFTISLANLQMPEGSHTIFGIGTSIVDNLNSSIRSLRDRDEWVWIVGDDHVFPPDTLLRLLDRGAEMIAPLCVRRGPPFPLVHYGEPIRRHSRYRRVIQLDDLPADDEPFEVEATGSLMLIHRRVLDAVGDPWFVGSPGKMDEEFAFCADVRAHGFRVLVDPAVTVGHIGELVASPARDSEGTWGLELELVGPEPHRVFYPGGLIRDGVMA